MNRTSKPKSLTRRGRPDRAQASAKALATVDLSSVDPRAILATIAADVSAPASARVAACKALLSPSHGHSEPSDDLSARAIRIMNGMVRN